MGGMPQQGPPPMKPVPPEIRTQFSVACLVMIYLTNNWNMVAGLQGLFGKMFSPVQKGIDGRKAKRERADRVKSDETARKARAARLRRLEAERRAEESLEQMHENE